MENSNNISIEDLGHMSFDTSETPVIDIYTSSEIDSYDPNDLKKLSVMIPKDLHKRLRIKSVSSETTITDLVVKLLLKHL